MSFLAKLVNTFFDGKDSPDLILINGNVITMDAALPRAQAVAVRRGLISLVGSNEEVKALKGPSTQCLDLKSNTLLPGFIEAHSHLLFLGRSLHELRLEKASNWAEVVEMVAKTAKNTSAGEWIIGSGWHQEKWNDAPSLTVEGYPTHHEISRVSPQNPVLLYHVSGHAALVNAKAMHLARIDSTSKASGGGEVLFGTDERPTGILFDAAISPVQRAIGQVHKKTDPVRRKEQMRRSVELTIQHALSKGVTSFQDAGSSFGTIDLLREMERENRLRMRLWVMINEHNKKLENQLSHYRITSSGCKRLTVRAVKRFMDGALASRRAWFLKSYADEPDETGLNVESPQLIEETARIALDHGFQLCVHAIGDRANRETLDLFERIFVGLDPSTNLRWRIEHAQHIHPDDIPRFAKLGVIASVQPVHAISDALWVEARLGARRVEAGAYAWRKLLDSGANLAIGTDAPVESVDPIANFYAAITRRLPDGTQFYPEQRMTREEALKGYTLGNAYAAFEDHVKGSVTPGKYADFVILSQDLTTVSEEKILDTRVLYTIVGGKIEYSGFHKSHQNSRSGFGGIPSRD